MGKKPFIDRKNAKHYHLVHRSQRDPLIVDEEASQRVLKEAIPINLMKHMTREEIEATLSKPSKAEEELENRVGQAPLYGINFDDVEYDYTQHLRNIGEEPDAVFLEAPSKRKEKKPQAGLTFVDEEASKTFQFRKDRKVAVSLPSESLPSGQELAVGLLAQPPLPDGLQPDMDPRLREVFEALEDEAFVEDGLEDDFFLALDAEGQPYVPEEGDDEYYDEEDEEGMWEDEERKEEERSGKGGGDQEVPDGQWKAVFKKFKAQQKFGGGSDDGEDDKRSGTTGYSMSSSAMFRNENLTLLDERFEKVCVFFDAQKPSFTLLSSDFTSQNPIEQEYEDDDDDDEDLPNLNTQDREDLDAILDEFLDKYEVVGRKMVPRLEGDTSLAKLETIRSALLETDEAATESACTTATDGRRKRREKTMEVDVWERPVKERQGWDVQSVLSTYSNLENHPRTIKEGPRRRIRINGKTGMPVVMELGRGGENGDENGDGNGNGDGKIQDGEDSESGSDDEEGGEEKAHVAKWVIGQPRRPPGKRRNCRREEGTKSGDQGRKEGKWNAPFHSAVCFVLQIFMAPDDHDVVSWSVVYDYVYLPPIIIVVICCLHHFHYPQTAKTTGHAPNRAGEPRKSRLRKPSRLRRCGRSRSCRTRVGTKESFILIDIIM
ncbi:hypothetical protein BC936DRAFT_146603 [Jimgerdemannia flammicorona]|uniref:Low temperature viability protein-domain-containing protein n=1 Tax=Jimgerdemannia flammicorona TaxID=994334 RepID=A0A433D778_9FUNG|nr:hypothetical protein BC936DRAFT_146603 [Jimgerdemannia flammicorona]